MSINDRIIARNEDLYNDEFERAQSEKAGMLSFFWSSYGILILAPVLAWSLPASHAGLSYLVLFPVFAGSIIGNSWLKKTVARPKINFFRYVWGWEWVFMIIIVAAWLPGLVRPEEFDLSTYTGGIIGAAVGLTLAVTLYPVVTGWQRKRDERRIERELED
ncbi:hypothetical protein [Corynebacterium sp. H130]|uniref:hypothetical protein n=1 Tax=Corynebacterium sp. H130 TaxID=3133444 RepID=UPI0030A97239